MTLPMLQLLGKSSLFLRNTFQSVQCSDNVTSERPSRAIITKLFYLRTHGTLNDFLY
jgi:hypothetical protein